jgi:hypothetical protein
MKIKEIKGQRGVRAFNIYSKLVIGIGMTYFNHEKNFEEFLKSFEGYEIEKKRQLLKWACLMVQLDDDEIEALTRFVADDDGIAYEKPALAQLKPSEIVNMMVEVALKISETSVFF